MLDSTTKNKIDSLRNLLVGKVPDPKSQVEQITIALFYKFMWDKDKEIKDLGGNATFFVGEFEKYSWGNLFSPDLGGSECIKLYSEAIEKMENNSNIPSVFRDIFKRAFLPYNDPYILRLFLKEINDFDYLDSEKLGDGFEYLLSILGSQGKTGQFRTPRHIIDFITKIVNPQKGDRICDPACGTAGFIISAYKHILKTNTNESSGDLLTPEDKKRLGNNLLGYDLDPMMVKLSLANMYLHGLNEPHIFEYDTLTSEERWDETYDIVLANPPFYNPTGGVRPHKKFAVNATAAQVLFTSYINTHLSLNGRAGIIVDEGIIFRSGNAYKELRKQLIESSLIGVISLPSGVFKPYSGVKTSILILDKELNKKTDKIFFTKVENDGFDLGDNRSPIDKNDLPVISKEILEYYNGLKEDFSNINFIDKQKILESNDIDLTYERYSTVKVVSDFKIVNLVDFVEFKRGKSITKKDTKPGKYPVIAGGQKPAYYHNEFNREGETITVSSSGAYAGFINYYDTPIFMSDSFSIKSKDVNILSNKFLFHLLKGKQQYIYSLQTGGGQPHIYAKDFRKFQIPLLSIETQKEIVKELEQYQKVIDGAKQVIDNYKPHFEINENWDKEILGNICDIKSGGTPKKSIDEYWKNGNIPWIGSTKCKDDFIDSVDTFITEEGLANSSAKLFNKNTVLIALVGATIGKTAYLKTETSTNQNIAGLTIKKDNPMYIFYAIQSIYNKFIELGDGGFRMANMTFIKNLKIPLPSRDIQNQIVDKLQKERNIVDGNKKLVKIYSQKIEDRINKIWGE